MIDSIVNDLRVKILRRLISMDESQRQNILNNCQITFDDWLLMHKLRNKAYFHGVINYDEFNLLNSWLGIDENNINAARPTLRILIIGTFQHIAIRFYKEKISID